MTDQKPQVQWDQLISSTDVRELFRYERGDEIRIYSLRVVASGAELWRVTEVNGEQTTSVKEAQLSSSDEALELLQEIERSLQAGGWMEV